jgi:hypothetical protein
VIWRRARPCPAQLPALHSRRRRHRPQTPAAHTVQECQERIIREPAIIIKDDLDHSVINEDGEEVQLGLDGQMVHQVPSSDPHYQTCKGFATDCKIGDVARVPSRAETDMSRWTITNGVIPPGDNTGNVISLVPVSGGFQAYSKQCDLCGSGSLIEKLTATTPTGRWTLTSQTWTVTAPSGCTTYSLYAHPADSGSGRLHLTYAVNGSAQYWLNQTTIPFP